MSGHTNHFISSKFYVQCNSLAQLQNQTIKLSTSHIHLSNDHQLPANKQHRFFKGQRTSDYLLFGIYVTTSCLICREKAQILKEWILESRHSSTDHAELSEWCERGERGNELLSFGMSVLTLSISIECASGTSRSPGLRPIVNSLSPRIHLQMCAWFMFHIILCSRVNWIPLFAVKGLWSVHQTLLRGASESLTYVWMCCCAPNVLSLQLLTTSTALCLVWMCTVILSHHSESSSCLSSGLCGMCFRSFPNY